MPGTQTTANILVGAAVVKIGDWVTAGGAATLVDIGHHKTPVEVQVTFEDLEHTSEMVPGIVKKSSIQTKGTIKIAAMESTIDIWKLALRQPDANKTGTTPNFTLRVGAGAERYHQIVLEGVGKGTNSLRTITSWRCHLRESGPMKLAKGEEQVWEMTFDVLYDETVTTADKFQKVVES